MYKIELRLLVLMSFISVELYAAADLIGGLKAAGEVIEAAKPVITGGAQVVGQGVEKVVHYRENKQKTKDRVTALEKLVSLCVPQAAFDESQQEQEEEIGRLRAAMPTKSHTHGFALPDPNDPLVTESKLKAVTAPLQSDTKGLQASLASCVTQQQLTDATAGTIKEDAQNPVVRQNQINDVVRQQDLQRYITKDDIKNGAKHAAGQFALGFSSYRLSWMIESLLQSAGMENEYVDLKDVSVPMTTFATSFAARMGKTIYNDQMVDPQKVAQKSLTDAASSTIVIALKNIFCDREMRSYFDENYSENQKAGMYGIAVVAASWILDMVIH